MTQGGKNGDFWITSFVNDPKVAFTYDVSSRGVFKMLTVADKGVGKGLSLADVSKNT